MNINSSFRKNKGTDNSCQSFKGIPADSKYLPGIIGKAGKIAGEYINTPEQKMFLAASALMFQPLMDLKFADEDKKTDAAIKSASKAIAGGITGVTARAVFQKITRSCIGFMKNNKLNSLFFPSQAAEIKKQNEALADIRLKQYCNSLGTCFALIFMICFSNSKIDVPITSDLQDFFEGVIKENKTPAKSIHDTAQARKKKIIDWFDKKKSNLQKIKNKDKKIFVGTSKKTEKMSKFPNKESPS